jgi:hypothetical protein
MKQSALHAPLTHTSPLPQLVPVAAVDQFVVDDDGVHTWHAFAGFVAPAAYVVPEIRQTAWHAPLEQSSPAPQLVPRGALDHAVVEAPGVHTWQAFAGLEAPEA